MTAALPALEQLRWRVDILLSTSAVSRVLRPAVLLQCTLSDGSVHSMEASLREFHQLRQATAEALHCMDQTTAKLVAAHDVAQRAAAAAERRTSSA